MDLAAGTKLGPYEILAPIGAGGMGEVYRAGDTRLGRIVAIKVLPSTIRDHPELRKRLEREARTLSNLSHPYICHLYDIGQQEGVYFLVMEYLEGETLASRLIRGPTARRTVAEVRSTDRGCARKCSPAWHHPSGLETRQHNSHKRWSEAARFRLSAHGNTGCASD
jgi:serine/threonine protein kinase